MGIEKGDPTRILKILLSLYLENFGEEVGIYPLYYELKKPVAWSGSSLRFSRAPETKNRASNLALFLIRDLNFG